MILKSQAVKYVGIVFRPEN